jgi:hypothetical protein
MEIIVRPAMLGKWRFLVVLNQQTTVVKVTAGL